MVRAYKAFIIITDIILINAVFFLANLLRFGYVRQEPLDYAFLSIFVTVIVFGNLYFFGLFRRKRYGTVDLLYKVFAAFSISAMLIATVAYFDWTFKLHRTIIALIWAIGIVVLCAWHYAFRPKIEQTINSLLVGTNIKKGVLTKLNIKKNLHVIGFLDDGKTMENMPNLGKIEEIEEVIEKYKINQVIIALPQKMHEKIFDIILRCYSLNVNFLTISDLYEFVLAGSLTEEGLIELNIKPLNIFNRVAKRLVDFFGSVILMVILSPLMLVIATLIKLGSEGPVLYKQKRLTLYNRVFTLYKFRTMIKDAEKQTGPVISDNKTDHRVTGIGRALRKTHLDEIPQLFNIFMGDMSFVGPRPERPELSEQFNRQIKEWSRRVYVKPGLTGLAQIDRITGLDPKNKIKRDLYYIQNYSLLFDIKIIFKTIAQLLKGDMV